MLDNLLRQLHERRSSDTVCNQYHDVGTLNNLRIYLSYLTRFTSDILLVGEAPGYRGCRITGIPFTSGDVIMTSKHDMFKDFGSNIICYPVMAEHTAKMLWTFLEVNNAVPILWNAFPFHPHQSRIPTSNRKPNVSEVREGNIYLRLIYDLFKPKTLCSLGRVGESVLKEMFPNRDIMYIRHPSYGGKKDFIEGMKKVYKNILTPR